MKLNEIIEPQYSEVNLKRKFNPSHYSTHQSTELGRGSFSVVNKDPTDPHLVKKHQISGARMTDSFDEYARIIVKEKLWEMVHFPRIYVTKKFIDTEGMAKYQWKMEKLLKFKEVDDEELIALNERYFEKETDNPLTVLHNVADSIKYYEPKIKDETLKAAALKLGEIYKAMKEKDSQVLFDLHKYNLMFRRSSYGLDIIFSDPFASQKANPLR